MPISLGCWEWGRPKRGDAHITDTGHFSQRAIGFSKQSIFSKPIHATDGAPIYICINVTASWLRLRLGQSCVALHYGIVSRVTCYETAGWLQFPIFRKINEIERLV